MANIIGTNGNDTLSASGSKSDNLLSGGDGNDSLDISGYLYRGSDPNSSFNSVSSGNKLIVIPFSRMIRL